MILFLTLFYLHGVLSMWAFEEASFAGDPPRTRVIVALLWPLAILMILLVEFFQEQP